MSQTHTTDEEERMETQTEVYEDKRSAFGMEYSPDREVIEFEGTHTPNSNVQGN